MRSLPVRGPRKQTFLLFPKAVLCGIIIFSIGESFSTMSQTADLKGEWSDACPCSIPCPCWRSSKSNVRHCVNIQLFHIHHGAYNGIDFDNSVFVLMNTPEGDFESPSPYLLYAPMKYQRNNITTLAQLFRERFKLSPRLGIRFVRIDADINATRHRVSIPQVLTYDVYAEGGLSSRLDNTVGPYLYPWLHATKQWRVQVVMYLPNKVEYQATNALYGQFNIASSVKEIR
jgi:hypothetical protein